MEVDKKIAQVKRTVVLPVSVHDRCEKGRAPTYTDDSKGVLFCQPLSCFFLSFGHHPHDTKRSKPNQAKPIQPQASKQTNKQTSKQTNKQTKNQPKTGKQTNKPNKQTTTEVHAPDPQGKNPTLAPIRAVWPKHTAPGHPIARSPPRNMGPPGMNLQDHVPRKKRSISLSGSIVRKGMLAENT